MQSLKSYILLISLIAPTYSNSAFYINLLYQEYQSINGELSSDDVENLAGKILNDSFNEDYLVCANSTCSNQCRPLLHNDNPIKVTNFESQCPQILYSLSQDCIRSNFSHQPTKYKKPTRAEVWGYSFLFVTGINLCSLAGIVVLPLMNKLFYQDLIVFLIALAVGSLCTNGVLVLIPEAFHIIDKPGYEWRAVSIVGGVYLFFLTERILKMITDCYFGRKIKSKQKSSKNGASNGTIPIQTFVHLDRQPPDDPERLNQTGDDKQADNSNLLADSNEETNGDMTTDLAKSASSAELLDEDDKPVSTIAWMIIFGDAFHNFIDGLGIGAAFAESIILGITISVAVLCEELPHELGDFAILLHAGMSKKKALLFNFLSACTCYLGLVIGIMVSEAADASVWILGIAGGMFLYISLADMMPEMNHAAERNKNSVCKIFFLQNVGLLVGFSVILVITLYGGLITF